jgi:hypothetical protein
MSPEAPYAANAPRNGSGAPATPRRRLGYMASWQTPLASRRTGASGFRPEDWGPAPPLPSRKKLRGEFHRARAAGASFVLMRTGDGAAELAETLAQARYLGFDDYWDFVLDACRIARETVGPGNRALCPALEFDAAPEEAIRVLAPHVDHFLYDLDTADDDLLASGRVYRDFPRKSVASHERQLDAFLEARARVVAGLMIGVGESPTSRDRAFAMLRDFRQRGGHLAGVVLTPFTPNDRSPMRHRPMASTADVVESVARARAALPKDVAVCLRVEGRDDALEAIRGGKAPADGMGYVMLNRPLANGMPEGRWFADRVGNPDRHRDGGGPIEEPGLEWVESTETGPWPAARAKKNEAAKA